MNAKIPVLALLLIGAVIGYLLGTESGQEQRDRLLVLLGRAEADADAAIEVAEEVLAEAAADADAATADAD